MNLENLYKLNNPSILFNIHKELISKEFVANNVGKPYREIWVGSRFCYGLNMLKGKNYQIRAIKEEFPDFQLKDDNELLSFEATEIMEKNRRRGDEYKNDTGEMRHIDIISKDECIDTINNAIQRKIKKYANNSCSLICYNNIRFSKIDKTDVEGIAEIFKKQNIPFNEIWLFKFGKAKAYYIAKIYPNIEQLYQFQIDEIE